MGFKILFQNRAHEDHDLEVRACALGLLNSSKIELHGSSNLLVIVTSCTCKKKSRIGRHLGEPQVGTIQALERSEVKLALLAESVGTPKHVRVLQGWTSVSFAESRLSASIGKQVLSNCLMLLLTFLHVGSSNTEVSLVTLRMISPSVCSQRHCCQQHQEENEHVAS